MKPQLKFIADTLIPLLGFFFWNWTVHFVLLFFVLDLFAKEILFHLKTFKILKTQGSSDPSKVLKTRVLSILTLLGIGIMSEILAMLIVPNYSFTQELYDFWMLEDTGFPQGYFLIPLIGFMVYMDYKLSFVKLKMHLKMSLQTFSKEHLSTNLAFLFVLIFSGLLATIIQWQEIPLLIVLLFGPYLLKLAFEKTRKS